MKRFGRLSLLLVVTVYPVDGYRETGIRRLELSRLRLEGELPGPVPGEGGRKTTRDIRLQLLGRPTSIPAPDPALQAEVDRLLHDRDDSYSVALLDISPGRTPRFAARGARRAFQPGSVGKLAVAAGRLTELAALYPQSMAARQQLLRSREVEADFWIRHDHHRVPLFDVDTRKASSRPIREGDVFTLYEWLDHMLSASSNAAASTVWKEAILMRAFGRDYPPSRAEETRYFDSISRSELREIAVEVVNDPLRRLGIAESEWKLGSCVLGSPAGHGRAGSRTGTPGTRWRRG